MSEAKVFEFVYHSGKPDGIISIRECGTSTMAAYVIPRDLLADARKIDEINRPGIYYLIGESGEGKIARIYIGKTTKGISRIYNHDRNEDKKFWDKAILFLADEKSFHPSMIDWLEKCAIEKARASKLYAVDNDNTPQGGIVKDKIQVIEKVYKEIQFIMEALGYRMSAHAGNGKKAEAGEAEVFRASRKGRGIEAFGTYDGRTFLLLEGSEVNFENPAKTKANKSLRDKLLKNGDIVQEGGKYILKKPLPFGSPCGAIGFVFGNFTNGWNEWKRDDGKTLDEVYRKKQGGSR